MKPKKNRTIYSDTTELFESLSDNIDKVGNGELFIGSESGSNNSVYSYIGIRNNDTITYKDKKIGISDLKIEIPPYTGKPTYTLPDGYTEYNYIKSIVQSTSTYINLKFYFNFADGIVCKFNAEQDPNNNYMFLFGASSDGTKSAASAYCCRWYNTTDKRGTIEWGYAISGLDVTVWPNVTTPTYGKDSIIFINSRDGYTLIHDGIISKREAVTEGYTLPTSGSSRKLMTLFLKNKSTSGIDPDWKSIYNTKVYYLYTYNYTTNEYTHYFVPCTNSNGKKGVYDVITNTWCPSNVNANFEMG